MGTIWTNNELCNMSVCRFAYSHFYDYKLCGSIGIALGQPNPAPGELVNDRVKVDSTEEPLAEWEKELLKPDPNQVIHLWSATPEGRCDIDLSDGKMHVVNAKIENVTCRNCRLLYLTAENKRLQEKVRVAEQATGMVRDQLRSAQRHSESRLLHARRLQEELNRSRGEVRYYPVDRYGRPL